MHSLNAVLPFNENKSAVASLAHPRHLSRFRIKLLLIDGTLIWEFFLSCEIG